jgi:transposase
MYNVCMVYDKDNVPSDTAILQALVIEQSQMIAELQGTVNTLTDEIRRLTSFIEKFFGKSSEKLSKDKPPDETPKSPALHKKRPKNGGGGRSTLPAKLPRVEKRIDVPEDERRCSCCGKLFHCIGEDRSEQLHFKPMELYVVVQVLMKYMASCPCSEKRSATAEPPIRPIDKGVASTSLLSIIAVMKYLDHLPLARQATQLFKRSGVDLSQSSMCRWMGNIADLLFPLYELMHEKLLESSVLQVDATTAKYIDPSIRGKAKQGTVWGYNGDATRPYVLYDFLIHGRRDGPESFLKHYHGYLQCDAHSVYDGIFAPVDVARQSPIEVGCWAHGRRKFYDARELNKEAFIVLEWIGSLYKLERKMKNVSNADRHLARQQSAVPILDDIFCWCREHHNKFLPKDPLTGAIQYALNHEAALRRYCDDGRLEIDNNAAERVLRLIAIGRKNWLFYGSERGGRTGAVLHSVLASAKRNGLNEYVYLCDVLDRLADLGSEAELYALLPDHGKPVS